MLMGKQVCLVQMNKSIKGVLTSSSGVRSPTAGYRTSSFTFLKATPRFMPFFW